MEKRTRAGIIALGSIAAIAAIAAVALYEEDENQRISKLWDDASRQARRTGRQVARHADQIDWAPTRKPFDRVKDSAADAYDYTVQKGQHILDK